MSPDDKFLPLTTWFKSTCVRVGIGTSSSDSNPLTSKKSKKAWLVGAKTVYEPL